MKIFNLMYWWRKRSRNIDREILFPEIFRQAKSDQEGIDAILAHTGIDSAWKYPHEYEHEDLLTGNWKLCSPHCDH